MSTPNLKGIGEHNLCTAGSGGLSTISLTVLLQQCSAYSQPVVLPRVFENQLDKSHENPS